MARSQQVSTAWLAMYRVSKACCLGQNAGPSFTPAALQSKAAHVPTQHLSSQSSLPLQITTGSGGRGIRGLHWAPYSAQVVATQQVSRQLAPAQRLSGSSFMPAGQSLPAQLRSAWTPTVAFTVISCAGPSKLRASPRSLLPGPYSSSSGSSSLSQRSTAASRPGASSAISSRSWADTPQPRSVTSTSALWASSTGPSGRCP
mmetsp:Transcript_162976/g.395956  ORF Transcript_162976/g.395956 Transcript_162976/m.395956 type:complete len:202 (+) Transcript_162976:581-1186(+)